MKDVSVSGFTVRSFAVVGIDVVGARNATITGNRAIGNGNTGIGTQLSLGTKILSNVTRGPGEVGIGMVDVRQENVKVSGNDVSGNIFGFFVGSNFQRGSITANQIHHNCSGMIFSPRDRAPRPTSRLRATPSRTTPG